MSDPAAPGDQGVLFGGFVTALPTPFDAGALDADGLARLRERQIVAPVRYRLAR